MMLDAEDRATAASVRALLHPSAVAIAGASRRPGSIGAALLDAVCSCGFKGAVYPVNPAAGEIAGMRCYPSVSSIGAAVDVALVAVPAPQAEGVVRDCAAAGVKGVIVISSGFGEVSAEGRAAERRMGELARASGMRLVGPNCMGVVNTDPAVSLNATFVHAWSAMGNIGLFSQSGALGYVVFDHIRSRGLGISSFVSAGNTADVSATDLLCYWAEDPATRVIMLYLEGFNDPLRFARIAPRVSRLKPIVAIKSGRSASGRRAASSHTAALAGEDRAADALLDQAGVIRVSSLEELMDAAAFFASQAAPRGRRVAIITNGGGPGVLLADACEARGLEVPPLSDATVDALRPLLPPQASPGNPVDMIASAAAGQYAAAVSLAGNEPGVDALIAIYIPPQFHRLEEVVAAISAAANQVPAEKPVLAVYMSAHDGPPSLARGAQGKLPTYRFPDNAASALAAALRYGRWRDRPPGRPRSLEPAARAAVRNVIDGLLPARRDPVWLGLQDIASVLGAAGIDFAPFEICAPETAPEAAARLGFPVVLKVQSDLVLHKTDLGGVLLGLGSGDEVAAGIETLGGRMRRAGVPLDQVLVQKQIRGGMEAIVGAAVDAQFGPLLVCGLGGILTEMIQDVSCRLAPVTDADAGEMLDGLRARRLLDGYRGSPPADRAALLEIILRVSALAEAVPELRELDLNPVKVLEPGSGAIAVDARIRLGTGWSH